MEEYYSRRNIDFLLNEVFDLTEVLKLDKYKQHDLDSIKLVMDSADRFSKKELSPYFEVMDREQPVLEDGRVKVHPQIRKMMKGFGEGGWISTSASEAWGGTNLPSMVSSCNQFIFGVANYAASVYPFLSTGVARLIDELAEQHLKEEFLPKLYSGEWQGTMVMTEPDVGSSLSDITTSAEVIDEGEKIYRIKGQKKNTSAGDHDGVDNVIHLVLAHIAGGSSSTEGLSLFIVPQKRVEKEGKVVSNDVTTSGIFYKMGCKGTPIVQLNFGDKECCFGHLLGEVNQGLKHMSQMMNEARIAVGISATSISSAAYYASLNYVKCRKQGGVSDEKNGYSPQVAIIEHADVKRMLLHQKAVTEGSLSLLINCAYYDDMAKAAKQEVREIYRLILDLLTPVAKTYPSEYGQSATADAIQIHGGAGYCTGFSVEQHYRDMKIHSIQEGTTGVHGLDLLGRKIIMGGGIAFRAFTEQVTKTIKRVKFEIVELSKYGEKLNETLFRLQNITMRLSTLAMKERKEVFLMDATLYLELFGIVTIGWQWLLQAIPCQIAVNEGRAEVFHESKLHTMKYYYEYEISKAEGLISRLNSNEKVLIDIEEEHFM